MLNTWMDSKIIKSQLVLREIGASNLSENVVKTGYQVSKIGGLCNWA